MKKLLKGFMLLFGLGSLILVIVVGYLLTASLPNGENNVVIKQLDGATTVSQDQFGVPLIRAKSRQDAFMTLGYLTARDRLFQMDLLRRRSSGRLAEIFGEPALKIDSNQRILGFERVAKKVATQLPPNQKDVLQAYVEGVNHFIAQQTVFPFEFLALQYQPEPWRQEDCILVALSMFQLLSGGNQDERMLSIMHHLLPAKTVAFFTPDADSYDTILQGGEQSHRPAQPIPAKQLASLLQPKPWAKRITPPSFEFFQQAALIRDVGPGSNQWAVSGLKTHDHRAILANDMHLPLGVPNIWYRASLQYGNTRLAGVTLPGVPLLLAGTNNKVAWGYTNLMADVRDLVKLDLHPDDQNLYQTPEGWQAFETTAETIKIKDQPDFDLTVKQTIWGPVMPETLLGHPVALKWSALDPATINFNLLDIDQTDTLEDAITLFNQAGMPPSNIMLADDQGNIAWTLTGSIPFRKGFDGSEAVSWAKPNVGWQGYIKPSKLPRVVNPPQGFLATANNRTLGTEYPYVVGHNYGNSYRAFRISQRLTEMENIKETDLHQLQLDTVSDFYQFYHQLALNVLTDKIIQNKPGQADLRQAVKSWDGKANVDSLGFGLLVEFRKQLVKNVLPSFFQACQKLDPNFHYHWYKMDTPLRALLSQKIPETQPKPDRFSSWNQLILTSLEQSADKLKQTYDVQNLQALPWGIVNRPQVSHPFSKIIPAAGSLLDMPTRPLSGCSFCVNVTYNKFGVSQRLVVSPGHMEEGILVMPAGQSGHPLSPNYNDQHTYWQQGLPLKLISDIHEHKTTFVPNNTQ